MAVTFGWKGVVDTDLQFSEFYNNDHTVIVWFLLQYPRAYAGSILSVNGTGNYIVSQGDYNVLGAPHLISGIDTATPPRVPPPIALNAGQWYQLAVVRSGNEITLFLNGQMLGSPLILTNTNAPSGTLRLGRAGSTWQVIDGREAQFYGMMDELAVYTRALTSAELLTQFTNHGHLIGNEPDLLAGWLFSPVTSSGLPARMLRNVVFSGQTALVTTSTNWNGSDTLLIPLPQHQIMRLPFPLGEAWGITQGFAAPFTHHGYAAFCFDFQKADSENKWTDVYPNGSFNAPIFSTEDGVVTQVSDDCPLNGVNTGENFVLVQCADGFTRQYIHLLKDSILVSIGQSITSGQQIAKICNECIKVNTGPHLHFAVISDPNDPHVVTIPVSFTNYEVRQPNGSWVLVNQGIPQQGEVVRRVNPHKRHVIPRKPHVIPRKPPKHIIHPRGPPKHIIHPKSQPHRTKATKKKSIDTKAYYPSKISTSDTTTLSLQD